MYPGVGIAIIKQGGKDLFAPGSHWNSLIGTSRQDGPRKLHFATRAIFLVSFGPVDIM